MRDTVGRCPFGTTDGASSGVGFSVMERSCMGVEGDAVDEEEDVVSEKDDDTGTLNQKMALDWSMRGRRKPCCPPYTLSI